MNNHNMEKSQEEAARLVSEKRARRRQLMDMGLSFEHAVLIVNKEYCDC